MQIHCNIISFIIFPIYQGSYHSKVHHKIGCTNMVLGMHHIGVKVIFAVLTIQTGFVACCLLDLETLSTKFIISWNYPVIVQLQCLHLTWTVYARSSSWSDPNALLWTRICIGKDDTNQGLELKKTWQLWTFSRYISQIETYHNLYYFCHLSSIFHFRNRQ